MKLPGPLEPLGELLARNLELLVPCVLGAALLTGGWLLSGRPRPKDESRREWKPILQALSKARAQAAKEAGPRPKRRAKSDLDEFIALFREAEKEPAVRSFKQEALGIPRVAEIVRDHEEESAADEEDPAGSVEDLADRASQVPEFRQLVAKYYQTEPGFRQALAVMAEIPRAQAIISRQIERMERGPQPAARRFRSAQAGKQGGGVQAARGGRAQGAGAAAGDGVSPGSAAAGAPPHQTASLAPVPAAGSGQAAQASGTAAAAADDADSPQIEPSPSAPTPGGPPALPDHGAFRRAAEAYARQPAVAKRSYLLCLAGAYERRYGDAGSSLKDAMDDIERKAAPYFEKVHHSGRASKFLRGLRTELRELAGKLRASEKELKAGKDCMRKEVKPRCYDAIGGPIAATMKVPAGSPAAQGPKAPPGPLSAIQRAKPRPGASAERHDEAIASLLNRVDTSGEKALDSLGAGAEGKEARDFLDGRLRAYRQALATARSRLTDMDWGQEKAVMRLHPGFSRKHKAVATQLDAIAADSLPAAGREPFRKAREKAKERLASAAAAFDAMEEPALTEQDSILRYLAAHGKMRESAGALSEVVVSLGLPGLPGGGQGGADGDGADLERCDPLSFSKPARGR